MDWAGSWWLRVQLIMTVYETRIPSLDWTRLRAIALERGIRLISDSGLIKQGREFRVRINSASRVKRYYWTSNWGPRDSSGRLIQWESDAAFAEFTPAGDVAYDVAVQWSGPALYIALPIVAIGIAAAIIVAEVISGCFHGRRVVDFCFPSLYLGFLVGVPSFVSWRWITRSRAELRR